MILNKTILILEDDRLTPIGKAMVEGERINKEEYIRLVKEMKK